jgi:hypothetical protein
VGLAEKTAWLEEKLRERFEIKCNTIGSGAAHDREGRVLNRVIRRTNRGWEYEADQRHSEIIVAALKLTEAKGVKTPGEEIKEGESDMEELDAEKATRYRALAARANYLALDRPDIQYTVKELCRGMSKPKAVDWLRLKRLGRYLVDHPRLISKFEWQREGTPSKSLATATGPVARTVQRAQAAA